MSSTEAPIHAPTPDRDRHWNQKGDAPRVRLAGGPHVDQDTLANLREYHNRGLSYGEAIDRLVRYAKAQGFDPVTQTHLAKPTVPRPANASRK